MDIKNCNYKSIKKVSIIGIIFNILIAIVKFLFGTLFSINSLTVDSVHSIEDSLSSILGLISSKIASKKPSKKHPYGYEKIEYIFSLIIGIFMIVAGLTMLVSSIKSIVNLNKIEFSYIVLIICVINIIIKFLLYIYSRKNYKKTFSVIIKAMMIDHRNDCIITLFTALSIVISYFGFYYMDGICGIVLSILIGTCGVKIFINSCSLLLDLALNESDICKIKEYIQNLNDKIKVKEILSRNIGGKYIVTVKLTINENLNLKNMCSKINEIKRKVLNDFGYIKEITLCIDFPPS